MRIQRTVSDEKLDTLFRLLANAPIDQRPNLAILTENAFLFLYKERLSLSRFLPGSGPVSGINPVRGDVMDFFAQLELIINQIFAVRLKSPEAEVTKLEQLLDCVDLSMKVKLLNDWSLIDNRLKELLMCLKAVRNGFAHNWDIKEVKYKGKLVVRNFAQFKKDASIAFSALIGLYNSRDVDLDTLISELAG